MSLLPLLRELLDDYRRPGVSDLCDQHFGLGLLNDEVLQPMNTLMSLPLRCGYLRPWRSITPSNSGTSIIQSDQNEFKINLDVQQFKPDELKVKISDGYLLIEGKHEERSDEHGFVSRQFTRRYKIPKEVNESTLSSSLSSDGILSLSATKKVLPPTEGREIPITQTNQPSIKETSEVKIQQ